MTKKLWALVIAAAVAVVAVAALCCLPKPSPRRGVVTEIELYVRQGDRMRHTVIRQPDQMASLLHYLRGMEKGRSADVLPPDSPYNSYTILVRLANGNSHVYRQQSDIYFSADAGQWRVISAAYGKKLPSLVKNLQR